jgi:hypothetical protein
VLSLVGTSARLQCHQDVEYFERPVTRMEAFSIMVSALRSRYPREDNWDTLVEYAKHVCTYFKPKDFSSEALDAVSHQSPRKCNKKDTPGAKSIAEFIAACSK